MSSRSELISRIMKKALRKGSATSDEDSFVRRDDDDTDTEHQDSLPHDEEAKDRRFGLSRLQQIRRTRKPSLVDIVQIAKQERARAGSIVAGTSGVGGGGNFPVKEPHPKSRFKVEKSERKERGSMKEKRDTRHKQQPQQPPPYESPKDNEHDPDTNSRIVSERRASLLLRRGEEPTTPDKDLPPTPSNSDESPKEQQTPEEATPDTPPTLSKSRFQIVDERGRRRRRRMTSPLPRRVAAEEVEAWRPSVWASSSSASTDSSQTMRRPSPSPKCSSSMSAAWRGARRCQPLQEPSRSRNPRSRPRRRPPPARGRARATTSASCRFSPARDARRSAICWPSSARQSTSRRTTWSRARMSRLVPPRPPTWPTRRRHRPQYCRACPARPLWRCRPHRSRNPRRPVLRCTLAAAAPPLPRVPQRSHLSHRSHLPQPRLLRPPWMTWRSWTCPVPLPFPSAVPPSVGVPCARTRRAPFGQTTYPPSPSAPQAAMSASWTPLPPPSPLRRMDCPSRRAGARHRDPQSTLLR